MVGMLGMGFDSSPFDVLGMDLEIVLDCNNVSNYQTTDCAVS